MPLTAFFVLHHSKSTPAVCFVFFFVFFVVVFFKKKKDFLFSLYLGFGGKRGFCLGREGWGRGQGVVTFFLFEKLSVFPAVDRLGPQIFIFLKKYRTLG